MRTDDLRVLLHLSEHGSIRGAAQRLGVTRSALRRQLERLERALDAPLVFREARGIRLTPAGELAASRARRILTEVGAMGEQVRALAGQAHGVVRMILPLGLPPKIRIAALLLMRERHPELSVHVREVAEPRRCTHLPFDVLAHFGPRLEEAELVSRVLMKMERRLYASPAYLECHGAPASVQALAEHPLLLWRAPEGSEEGLPLRGGGEHPIRPWFLSSDAPAVLLAAERGLGIALLPSLMAEPKELVPVLGKKIGDRLTLRFASPHPSRVDPRVRALLSNLRDVISGAEPPPLEPGRSSQAAAWLLARPSCPPPPAASRRVTTATSAAATSPRP